MQDNLVHNGAYFIISSFIFLQCKSTYEVQHVSSKLAMSIADTNRSHSFSTFLFDMQSLVYPSVYTLIVYERA